MTIRLQYIGRLLADGPKSEDVNPRQWHVVSPELPGYLYGKGRYPAFGLDALREIGLLR